MCKSKHQKKVEEYMSIGWTITTVWEKPCITIMCSMLDRLRTSEYLYITILPDGTSMMGRPDAKKVDKSVYKV